MCCPDLCAILPWYRPSVRPSSFTWNLFLSHQNKHHHNQQQMSMDSWFDKRFLQSQNLAQRCVLIEAQEAKEEDLRLVHEADYVQKICTLNKKVKLHWHAPYFKKCLKGSVSREGRTVIGNDRDERWERRMRWWYLMIFVKGWMVKWGLWGVVFSCNTHA